jgi:hypothetical protein
MAPACIIQYGQQSYCHSGHASEGLIITIYSSHLNQVAKLNWKRVKASFCGVTHDGVVGGVGNSEQLVAACDSPPSGLMFLPIFYAAENKHHGIKEVGHGKRGVDREH